MCTHTADKQCGKLIAEYLIEIKIGNLFLYSIFHRSISAQYCMRNRLIKMCAHVSRN